MRGPGCCRGCGGWSGGGSRPLCAGVLGELTACDHLAADSASTAAMPKLTRAKPSRNRDRSFWHAHPSCLSALGGVRAIPRRPTPGHPTNVGLTLGQRLRRWPNLKPTLVRSVCYASNNAADQTHQNPTPRPQTTPSDASPLGHSLRCWPNMHAPPCHKYFWDQLSPVFSNPSLVGWALGEGSSAPMSVQPSARWSSVRSQTGGLLDSRADLEGSTKDTRTLCSSILGSTVHTCWSCGLLVSWPAGVIACGLVACRSCSLLV